MNVLENRERKRREAWRRALYEELGRTLSEAIEEARSRGTTVVDIARMAGMSTDNVYRIMRGRAQGIAVHNLIALMDALGLSPCEVLDRLPVTPTFRPRGINSAPPRRAELTPADG